MKRIQLKLTEEGWMISPDMPDSWIQPFDPCRASGKVAIGQALVSDEPLNI